MNKLTYIDNYTLDTDERTDQQIDRQIHRKVDWTATIYNQNK